MTNKELISYENERLEEIRQYLEEIRQYLIEIYGAKGMGRCGEAIKELGEIIYELETKIKDNGPKNQRKNRIKEYDK